MRWPRGKPTLMVFFLLVILMPSAVLTFLSFRSISNEFYVAQKSYDDDAELFAQQTEQKASQEFTKLLEEVRASSIWLLNQPRNLDELSKPMPFDSIAGVQAMFLFDAQGKVHPRFTPLQSVAIPAPNLVVDSFDISVNQLQNLPKEYLLRLLRSGINLDETKHINNLLGLLRIYYQQENWKQCLAIIHALQKKPEIRGVFNSAVHVSLELMHFNILVQTQNLDQALRFAYSLIDQLLIAPEIRDLPEVLFVFDAMLNTVLSFESLSAEQRESLWYIHKNLSFLLHNAVAWNTYEDLLLRLRANPYPNSEGISFLSFQDQWGFRMTHPWLQGTQELVGVIDVPSLNRRIMHAVRPITREWKDVYFALCDSEGRILLSRNHSDSLQVISETILLPQQLNWTLQVLQRDLKELRYQSRKKMFLLYSLVFFSLLVLLLGGVVFSRGLAQERSLLAMKGNFLSSISHELKTPLTSIKMFAEMMAQGRVQKTEKVAEYATLIGKEATRLEDLIQAILDYTRMERADLILQKKPLNLSQITAEICAKVANLAQQKGLNLVADISPNLKILGDFSSLHSLIQNLLDNAIKYTPAPGKVQVSLAEQQDFYILSISDTGVGIELSEQSKIFNDFYRVGDEMTRSTKGSGLGLAIAKKAAEAHQANITLHSKPGKGSTFTVQFPKANYEL